jgi:hypothetical protein
VYECETWSLTLREEHTLRASENRVLGENLDPRSLKRQKHGEDLFSENIYFVIFTKYYYDDPAKEDERGRSMEDAWRV